MRRGDAASSAGHCRIGEIRYIAADPARLDLLDDCLLIDQHISRHVDEDHALFHFLHGFSADHPLCGRKSRYVNSDIIAPVIDLIQVEDMRDLSVEVPGCVYRYIGIVAKNFHAQFYRHIGHAYADRAKTDDSQSLARELGTGKFLFLFLGSLRNVLVVPVRADPVNAFYDVAGCEQHSSKDHLLHAVGICSGCVKNNNTLSGTAVHRNIVDTCAGSCDRKQLRREVHVVHRSTPYQDSLRLREVLSPLILRCERLQALFRNVVETCIFEH